VWDKAEALKPHPPPLSKERGDAGRVFL